MLIAVLAIGVILAVVALLGVGTREGSDMELVGYAPYQMGTDFQFQRRSGPHTLDGVSVNTATDLVFAGAHHVSSRGDGGIEIIDITDPSDPAKLARIPCPGYQSDVAVHETLLLQTLDHAPSNAGCDAGWLENSGSAAVDMAGTTGLRIFDVADPARPQLVHFIEVVDELGGGVHNVTVLPWAGIAYLSELDGELGIVDLTDSAFPYSAVEVTSISSEMITSCHDIGLDAARLLAFCAANEKETYILDVRDPMRPVYVAKIVNEGLSRHHEARMAPDGMTLVLESEYDHPPEVDSEAPAGLWFYDLTDPTDPGLLGQWAPDSCEPSERDERTCTSHSFNFVPGTELVAASWRHEGVFLVDYADPGAPVLAGAYRPAGGGLPLLGTTPDFWAAYAWHGHVYASAGDAREGLHVLGHADLTDGDPSDYDEGTSWGRWTAEGS